VPVGELAASTQHLVDELLRAPRNSLRAVKVLINSATDRSKVDQLQMERSLQLGLLRDVAAALKPAVQNPTGAA